MIVAAVLLMLAAISIPNLMRARLTSQEAAAAVALHTIASVELQWRATNPGFASLSQLGSATPPYIDSVLASGTKLGYTFSVTPSSSNDTFFACATPSPILVNAHGFYIDEEGILCRTTTTAPLPDCTSAGQQVSCPDGFAEMQ